ncbi:MAG: hypothetical protein AM1032_000141 [Mycoplasmataceae bacterium]|nr:MAG: hypothetical protein AM1032_000141 [Mycoplasmataceae bacterium]
MNWKNNPDPNFRKTAFKKLVILNSVKSLEELDKIPSIKLRKFKGYENHYSINIDEQYCICFNWVDGDAYDVEITEHHE